MRLGLPSPPPPEARDRRGHQEIEPCGDVQAQTFVWRGQQNSGVGHLLRGYWEGREPGDPCWLLPDSERSYAACCAAHKGLP